MKQLRFIGGGQDECELFTDGSEIYRAIPNNPINRKWKKTNDIIKSPAYKKLVDLKYALPYEPTNIDPNTFPTIFNRDPANRQIYKAEYVPFFLHPTDKSQVWTIYHYKKFLQRYSQINEILYSYDLICHEPNLSNFAFIGANPILVDIGAISNCFDLCVLIKDNILRHTPKDVHGVVKGVDFRKKNWWDNMLSSIDKINDKPKSNRWNDYNSRALPSPNNPVDSMEVNWLRNHIHRDIRTVLDIGGNDGNISFALEHPGIRCCSIDIAEGAIVKGMKHAELHGMRTTFYKIDVFDGPPNENKITGESVNWEKRLQADAVIASSVLHHFLRQNRSIESIINVFNRLASKYLFIEFIDSKDPHTRNWPQSWTIDEFMDVVTREWSLIDTLKNYEGNKSSRPYRTWYAFKRKSELPFTLGVIDYKNG